MKNSKRAAKTTANKRAKTTSTQMETSNEMGKTTRNHCCSKAKNCGK